MSKDLKEKIKDKLLELGVFAATSAPLAPTSADAKTPDAPEQPKTEQFAPQENYTDNDHNGKTIYINGIGLTPVDEVPGSTPHPRTTTVRTRTTPQTRTVQYETRKAVQYGTPQWAEINGWRRDPQLSRGLNRLGNEDGSHNGYRGAYYKLEDPSKIMFLPNDPIHDKPEFADRGNVKASQSAGTAQYYHGGHDPHGYGCPDKMIQHHHIQRIFRGGRR